MLPSKHGHKASGVGKFWVAMGTSPETYSHGGFSGQQDAEAEARQMMAEDGRTVATIGEGEEVELYIPDADDIIERMCDGLNEQCGEVCDDYLLHVPKEVRAELTEAVEKAVAEWMTRHNLWPTFCKVEEVDTLHGEQPREGGE